MLVFSAQRSAKIPAFFSPLGKIEKFTKLILKGKKPSNTTVQIFGRKKEEGVRRASGYVAPN